MIAVVHRKGLAIRIPDDAEVVTPAELFSFSGVQSDPSIILILYIKPKILREIILFGNSLQE